MSDARSGLLGGVVDIGERLRPWCNAKGGISNRLQREAIEDFAHVLTGRLPYGEQNALPLMIARTVLVRLAEVSKSDRPIDSAENLTDPDLRGLACEHVPAADTALRTHQAGALQRQQDLLEVGLRKRRALGNVAHRCGYRLLSVKSQRQECPTGIVTLARNAHKCIVERVARWSDMSVRWFAMPRLVAL